MKKEECCSIFMTTLMIAIPVGAVVVLLIEIFSINGIYKMLTDLGSFIAGLIGFGGVIWLIWNQNKETRKILSSNIDMMKSESFEIVRQKAFDHWFIIESVFSLEYQDEDDFLSLKDIEKIKPSVHFLVNFMNRYSSHGYFYMCVISDAIAFKRSLSTNSLLTAENSKKELARSISTSHSIIKEDGVKAVFISHHTFDTPKGFADKCHKISNAEYISYVRHYVCVNLSEWIREEIDSLNYTSKNILNEL